MLGKEQVFLAKMEPLISLPVGPLSVFPLLVVCGKQRCGQDGNKLPYKKAVVKT